MVQEIEIFKYPDKILRKKAADVVEITEEIRNLLACMIYTMQKYDGVGLAAVQVGVLHRMFTMYISETEIIKVINPKILSRSDEIHEDYEGCMSLPGVYEVVMRNEEVELEFLDELGNVNRLYLTGLSSVCAQHEIDHLNGKLFIDRMSAYKKRELLKKYKERNRQDAVIL